MLTLYEQQQGYQIWWFEVQLTVTDVMSKIEKCDLLTSQPVAEHFLLFLCDVIVVFYFNILPSSTLLRCFYKWGIILWAKQLFRSRVCTTAFIV